MNRTFDILKKLYKPKKIKRIGKTIIFETNNGSFLIKPQEEKNIKELYDYLESRKWTNFPRLIDSNRYDLNLYEYIDEVGTPKEQKAQDIINLLGVLHNKTYYYKEVNVAHYQSIYDNINKNIKYYKQYFDDFFMKVINTTYPSPSEYLFMMNATSIFNSLSFCESELKKWFGLVQEKKRVRVALVHRNMKLSHLLRKDKDYFVSWEKSKIDSPILDLALFFKNEWQEIEWATLLESYLKQFALEKDEEKLLFILLKLPFSIEKDSNELIKTMKMNELIKYLQKADDLIRPYYLEQSANEQN